MVVLLALALFSMAFAGAAQADARAIAAVEPAQPAAAPLLIRIFKDTGSLELWRLSRGRYMRAVTMPVCRFSGSLGPKLIEGDRQAPEGFYTIGPGDLMANLRWHRAMRLNYPNAADRASGRGGSGILIHGKCSSTGCFAMGDAQAETLHDAIAEALDAGQASVPVEIYPFALTAAALAARADDEHIAFWRTLKPAHDALLTNGMPAAQRLCGTDYGVAGRGRKARLASTACVALRSPAAFRVAVRRSPASLAATGAAVAAAIVRDPAACDPRRAACRLIRAALKSPVICPRKYARCRNAAIAAIKSVDCPLKYPRCRGRATGRYASRSAGKSRKR